MRKVTSVNEATRQVGVQSPSDGGFLLAYEDFARGRQFHSLGQDQSTMAQRAETTVDEPSLTRSV